MSDNVGILQYLAETVAAGALAVAGWLWSRVNSVDDKVDELRVDVAKNYATHSAIRMLIGDMIQPLNDKLDETSRTLKRIEDRLEKQ